MSTPSITGNLRAQSVRVHPSSAFTVTLGANMGDAADGQVRVAALEDGVLVFVGTQRLAKLDWAGVPDDTFGTAGLLDDVVKHRAMADARLTLETFRHYIGRLAPREPGSAD